jgi:glyoxylase-like metal-dependent hydrolase (beta-lactamase superfamily II)
MHQISLDPSARADSPVDDKERHDQTHEILPDLAYRRLGIVNVIYFGLPGTRSGDWVLIDAGLPGTANLIESAAAARFGKNSRPSCIIMTHAHADHAGGLEALAKAWQVPIFAHMMEIPYLNGTAAYPPPDPGVGGGAMPALSVLFPRGPFNVSYWLRPLPGDQTVPGMPEWNWIHTPGHTPGHVSLWRGSDRALIAGDAFITTDQESVYAVLTQKPEMHGPPMYYTQNWEDAEDSVRKLASLNAEIAVTGHGHAMAGEYMRAALNELANSFRTVAVPPHGKYVAKPTSAENGTAYVEKHKH